VTPCHLHASAFHAFYYFLLSSAGIRYSDFSSHLFVHILACFSPPQPSNSGSDGACFRSLGRVSEPQAKRSAEVCIGPPGVRDSHVYMTQTSPVELYVNRNGAGGIVGRDNDYLVVFTGECVVVAGNFCGAP
jgi:hypothetical protein